MKSKLAIFSAGVATGFLSVAWSLARKKNFAMHTGSCEENLARWAFYGEGEDKK